MRAFQPPAPSFAVPDQAWCFRIEIRRRDVLRRVENDARVLRVVNDDLMCKSVEFVWRWWGREGLVGKCQRR